MNLNRVLDAFPDPWTPRFLVLLCGASAVTAGVAAWRAGATALLPGLAALIVVLLAVFGRIKLNAAAQTGVNAEPSTGSPLAGYLLLGAAFAISLAVLATQGRNLLEWVAVMLPFIILAFCHSCFRRTGMLPLLVLPFMIGLICLDTAVFMGEPGAGGYPAVFAFFIALVSLKTRGLESTLRDQVDAAKESLDHPVHRVTMSLLSIIFFFFGVVSLWPWLGKLYGAGYLWVLILGVLAPMLYLWGRVKKPPMEIDANHNLVVKVEADTHLSALGRLNRLLPYIGLILLVAILIG